MLFICWRIGLISRALNRIIDSEVADIIFDATLFTLEAQTLTSYHGFYRQFEETQLLVDQKPEYEEKTVKLANRKMYNLNLEEGIGDHFQTTGGLGTHPFSHWTVHRHYIKPREENNSNQVLIMASLTKNPDLSRWLLDNLPCFGGDKTPWQTQETFSTVEQALAILSKRASMDQSGTKSSIEKEQDLVVAKVLNRDRFSFHGGGVDGFAFSWGSNNMGQLGSVASAEEPSPLLNSKPFLLYFPRPLLPIKNLIVSEVACGYSHSLAVLKGGTLLAWGSNRSQQLGLGPGMPDSVPSPLPVRISEVVKSAACGSEHSACLTGDSRTFTWGQGEGGLLGQAHFDSSPVPLEVASLPLVVALACGGLHTLALDKDGQVWSWGRGEGGQLGHSRELLVETADGELFQNQPRTVAAFGATRISQIAAGDAHSLALEVGGVAWAWGFSTSGQLGTGAFSHDHSLAGPGVQQFTPALVKLPPNKPVKKVAFSQEIFAGKTFSFFENCDHEVYGCGSNHFNQVGIPARTTNEAGAKIDQSEIPLPMKIDAFDHVLLSQIVSGPNHSLAMCSMAGRSVNLSWGSQRHAQLGLPTVTQHSTLPQLIHYFNDVFLGSVCSFNPGRLRRLPLSRRCWQTIQY
jgi:hypothetical protein